MSVYTPDHWQALKLVRDQIANLNDAQKGKPQDTRILMHSIATMVILDHMTVLLETLNDRLQHIEKLLSPTPTGEQ